MNEYMIKLIVVLVSMIMVLSIEPLLKYYFKRKKARYKIEYDVYGNEVKIKLH